MKLLELWDPLRLRRQATLFDDYFWYVDAQQWTKLLQNTAGGSASVTIDTDSALAEMSGVLKMVTGAGAGNEVAVATTNKPFLFDTSHPLVFETLMQAAEGNTNGLQPFLGFSSALNVTGQMQQSEAGPAASFSGVGLFKTGGASGTGGGTSWGFMVSIGTTQQTMVTSAVVGSSAYHTYRIEVRIGSQGTGYLEAVPFLDGQQMTDADNKPIKLNFLSTSAAAMQAGVYLQGGTSTSETMLVDYIAAGQLRPWPFT